MVFEPWSLKSQAVVHSVKSICWRLYLNKAMFLSIRPLSSFGLLQACRTMRENHSTPLNQEGRMQESFIGRRAVRICSDPNEEGDVSLFAAKLAGFVSHEFFSYQKGATVLKDSPQSM
jgi:hypothetical protein